MANRPDTSTIVKWLLSLKSQPSDLTSAFRSLGTAANLAAKNLEAAANHIPPQHHTMTNTTTLPETLLDMSPWGAAIFATPDAASTMAAKLGWDTSELDRVHLNRTGDAYLFHETQGGRTQTQVIQVRPGAAEGEFVAIND